LYVGVDSEEDADSLPRLSEAVSAALGGFQPNVVEFLPHGRAAGLAAVLLASTAIENGQISGAIVGGVDSLVRPSVWARLAQEEVLKDLETNPQGILPGEAAGFLVLERDTRRNPPLSILAAAGADHEPTAGTDDPNQGEGLTQALWAVRSMAGVTESPLAICDLNGDRYRALEWGLAMTRALSGLAHRPDVPGSGDFWHPADCTGDTGAASGILGSIWAMDAMAKEYGGGDQVLVWGASEGPLRAAVVLARPS
jgi:3-oxoacyl-[acyl-carrier-protein] synthase-1